MKRKTNEETTELNNVNIRLIAKIAIVYNAINITEICTFKFTKIDINRSNLHTLLKVIIKKTKNASKGGKKYLEMNTYKDSQVNITYYNQLLYY